MLKTILTLKIGTKIHTKIQTLIFLIPIYLQPDVVDLRYFKLRILSDQIVWNIKELQNKVVKI